MGLSGWHSYSGNSFVDLFSFSLNPEITSFLWKTKNAVDAESTSRYHVASPTNLFHILLFSQPEESTTVISTIRNTVVTTGILVIVGVSSLCAFRLLQSIRHEGLRAPTLQSIKTFLVDLVKPFILHWRRCSSNEGESVIDGTCCTKNNNEGGQQLCKRPSDLRILANGSPRNRSLYHSSRDNSLERRLLTKDRTPLADCEIASGEEDVAEIQGQYFGPTVKTQAFCIELTGSSPEDSPIHSASPIKGSSKKASPNKGLKRSSQGESEV